MSRVFSKYPQRIIVYTANTRTITVRSGRVRRNSLVALIPRVNSARSRVYLNGRVKIIRALEEENRIVSHAREAKTNQRLSSDNCPAIIDERK